MPRSIKSIERVKSSEADIAEDGKPRTGTILALDLKHWATWPRTLTLILIEWQLMRPCLFSQLQIFANFPSVTCNRHRVAFQNTERRCNGDGDKY